ncbi:MAG: nitroreductase family protein [Caldicoprobacter oshimai]
MLVSVMKTGILLELKIYNGGGDIMTVKEAIRARRTIRKYKQERIPLEVLKELVDGARLAPSAANRQPLEYLIVEDPSLLEPVFSTLGWAGYIKPHGTPKEGEKPTAYIVLLINRELDSAWAKHDVGAAVENILLGAQEYGIGCCWIGSVDRDRLREILQIPEKYIIDCVVALGYAAEKSVVEDEQGSIKYYKDENGVLHVPKRRLEDIMHVNRIHS